MKPVSIKDGLADGGLGIKTRTSYKMRTADYVAKNCAHWF